MTAPCLYAAVQWIALYYSRHAMLPTRGAVGGASEVRVRLGASRARRGQLGCANLGVREARRCLPHACSCLPGRLLRRRTPARPGPSTRNTRCGTTRTSTSSAMQERRTHANGVAKRREGRVQLGALQGMDARTPQARVSAWQMLRIV